MTRLWIAFLLLAAPLHGSSRQSSGDTPGQWVQLTFSGEITDAGGARLEIEIGAVQVRDDFESRQVLMNPHLARGTSAAEVAALIAQRLERAKFDIWLSDTRDQGGRVTRHLFVEQALFVRLRLGHGISASVTVCEGAPDSMRILPPELLEGEARLELAISALHAHTQNQRCEQLTMPLTFDQHAAQISSELARRCLERKWMAERPHQDSWRLIQLHDGARIVGFSVSLDTEADWRLELEFER